MKYLIQCLVYLIIALETGAQVFSPMQMVSDAPDDPLVLISADMNNDGYIDLIYSSTGDNAIRCSIYNPDNNAFDSPVLLGTGFPFCMSLYPADLDNDGLTDILAVSQTGNKVGWFKNNGNSGFELQPLINQNAPLAASVTAADIDSDGDMDVISAQKGNNTILLYLNNGDGTFSTPITITGNAHIPVVVVAADLNNDSLPDIIAGYGQSDQVVHFINNGDGTFQDETTVTAQADLITNIITADINGDGYIDIVSASKNDNKVAWYKNINGTGNFSGEIVISQSVTNAYGLACADTDLDGDIDIVASSPNDNSVYLFINNNLTFQTFLVSSEVKEPQGVATGDFDGDGLVDIAVAESWEAGYSNYIYRFVNGKSSFIVHNINQNISSWRLATNDFNGDGNTDIFYSGGQYIYYVENQGQGVFGNEQLLFQGGYNIYRLGFADANNDGYDDLFVLDAMGDRIFWFQNLNGSFGNPVDIDTQCDGPVDMDFSDIDGDGNIDILVAIANGNQILLYLNTQGNGTFVKTVVSNSVSPHSLCFNDYDNDGDKDIFYSDYDGINIMVNNGQGVFAPGGTAASFGTYSTKLIYADLNNDGYDDIICNPDEVTWLENMHDGTFSAHQIVTWGGSYDVSTGDINNDGYTDIISAGGIVNRAYYLKNINGGEDFEVNTYAVDVDIRGVLTANINNDGYTDIVLGSWPAENLSWAENYHFRIINNPVDTAGCTGGVASFGILTAGVTQYQWQYGDGQIWDNIENNEVFSGSHKALLTIYDIPENLFGLQFRCLLTDEENNSHTCEAATLNKLQPQIVCAGNQVRTASINNTYTVLGNEFDPDTVFNPCLLNLPVVNDYNGQSTLSGAVFAPGTYTIKWFLNDNQNNVVDSCFFMVDIEPYTQVNVEVAGKLRIFPNPFTGRIIVDAGQETGIHLLEIKNASGMTLVKKQGMTGKAVFDLSRYEKGVYFLLVKTETTVYIRKIIKF